MSQLKTNRYIFRKIRFRINNLNHTHKTDCFVVNTFEMVQFIESLKKCKNFVITEKKDTYHIMDFTEIDPVLDTAKE